MAAVPSFNKSNSRISWGIVSETFSFSLLRQVLTSFDGTLDMGCAQYKNHVASSHYSAFWIRMLLLDVMLCLQCVQVLLMCLACHWPSDFFRHCSADACISWVTCESLWATRHTITHHCTVPLERKAGLHSKAYHCLQCDFSSHKHRQCRPMVFYI